MNACTIVAKNYVAHARVLARSFAEHHPDGRFTVLVLDDFEGHINPAAEPFEVITPFEIGLPEFLVMAGTYDVLELSTAVKPWLLRTLLAHGDHVVYLDPDIEVHAPLDEVAELAREHGMVLTPHNVTAMPRDGKKPSEADILIAGAYNLGFISLGTGQATHDFLDWWAERLRTDCIVDTNRGYFVDQRWIDLAPGLVPSFHLLRDPGYNVAYWNLWTRHLERDGDGWSVNGSTLRFFHFSGYDPRRPDRLSKHQDRIDLAERADVRALCDGYAEALLREGFEDVVGLPYTYAASPGGIVLDRAARRLYADGVKHDRLGAPLFEDAGEAAFVAYAHEDLGGGLTRYMAAVLDTRPDLVAAFPERGERLVRWFVEDGVSQHPPQLLPDAPPPPPPPAPAAAAPDLAVPPAATAATVPFGVNLVGYLSAELGVGEVARQVVGALDAAEVPVLPQRQIAHASRQAHEYAARGGLDNPFAVNLLCVNADMTPAVAAEAGPGFFAGRHTIGWWWWEVQDFPEAFHPAFEHVDEVWVGSRFVGDAISGVSPVPVVRMPMPVTVRDGIRADRPALGLPDDAFVYLFAFDFNSVVARKNPVDLVRAYTRAHPEPTGETLLVLKAINGERHPDALAEVQRAIGDRRDVLLLDRYLSSHEKDALMASCDCYVSLHRSEGFGIGMAEASLLGKPVIATGYGGNVDFMAPAGGWLVRHELVPIGPGSDPYPAGGVWAQPDLDHAAELMRAVRERPEEARRRVEAAREHLLREHSPDAAGRAMRRRLDAIAETRAFPTASAQAEHALAAARDAAHRGPPRMPGRSPKKAVRAALLKSARPVLNHQSDVDRHLSWGLEQAVRALREELRREDAQLEARLLRELRRVERRIAAAEGRADVLAADVAGLGARTDEIATHLDEGVGTHVRSLDRHVAGLQEFTARAEAQLREASRIVDAAGAVPYMSDDALRVQDGELRFEGADPGGYRAFEDLFRGSEDMIRERQRRYLDVLRGQDPVLDAGCGRGELLDLLREEGIEAIGVDLDAELVERCREKGHERVEVGDAVAWLEAAEEGSLGAVVAMQVVEHLPEEVLLRFVAAAHRALRPGGVLIAETVNPHSPHALKAFWVDPSHHPPLFPEVLLQLARAAGFASGRAFCPNGDGDWERDRLVQGEYAVVASR